MKLVTFRIDQVRQQLRPDGYMQELRECATAEDSETLTFDTHSECWRALKEKYKDYKPTPADHRRVVEHTKSVRLAALVARRAAQPLKLNDAEPCNCGGRAKREQGRK